MRLLTVLAAVLVAVAGCSVPVAGTPSTPGRPREIRLDTVDPCTLLTDEQRKGFGIDQPPLSSPGGLNHDEADCNWAGFEPRSVDAHITVMTSKGIDAYDVTSSRVSATSITVAGFPALLITVAKHPEFCTVGIDVAAGQALDVQFRAGGRVPPVPQSDLCRDVKAIAETVMQNLLARG